MDLRYEIEMRALHRYSDRLAKGQVTGAEPFHVITSLLGSASFETINQAQRVMIDDRKRTGLDEGRPFPLNVEDLVSDASQECLLEVSGIFVEGRLIHLGQIDADEQAAAGKVFHEKYAGRHLQPVS